MLSLTIVPLAKNDLAYWCVDMLMRMYLRWADNQGYARQVPRYGIPQGATGEFLPSMNENGMGGLYWSVVCIDAPPDLLKRENGVHSFRLVSPFDTQARVHTVFVVVTVTWAGDVPERPIRHYDFVRNREVKDIPTGETLPLDKVLDGELLFGVEPKQEAHNEPV
jgi:hypothetical protein